MGKQLARRHFIHHVFGYAFITVNQINFLDPSISACAKSILSNFISKNKKVLIILIACVYRDNEFEDGNHFYRFLEHEPFIPRCYNFRGSTNDLEPKSATLISQKLAKLMSAILESYASEDGCHLDYLGISNSEEFRRYKF